MRRTLLLVALFLFALGGIARSDPPPRVRIAVLNYGSVNWELDVIRHHRLDEKAGVVLEAVELATPHALQVALLSGTVDVITTDWIWVSRQRAMGADFTFAPYTTSIGALVVPEDSPVRDLADLEGKRLGVAGGPLDKGWLLLRALFRKRHAADLHRRVEAIYGTPPLLNEQMRTGGIDAVLTYWNYAARLEADGFRRVIGVREMARALGVESEAPFLGFVFPESWAERNRDAIQGFLAASREAKAILRDSDAEWERIAPLVRAGSGEVLVALREAYREGIPRRWGKAERRDAARLYALLGEYGGEALTGGAGELAAGTFWREYRF